MTNTKQSTVLSTFLKYLTVAVSLGGVLLSLISARQDGYSHWGRRLLYFTAQSNIWLGITFLLILLLPLKKKNTALWKERLYVFKYIFTVSITITGLVFCTILAPFADEDYHPWRVCNLLTHVFSPFLAILDFFIDPYQVSLTKRQVFLPLIPPFAYFLLASVLSATHIDFGRGVSYPYFFLNFNSPAGVFGFSPISPFFIGSFYWIALLSLVVLFFAHLYARWSNKKVKRERKQQLK